MTESCLYNSSGKPTYYPVCLSPQRENFDYKGYFIDASINKKSVIGSNIFKNYNEEQLIKQQEQRIRNKDLSNFSGLSSSKCSNSIPLNVKFDYQGLLNKTHTKKTITNQIVEDHDSFESFTHGFTTRSCVDPSFTIANKYLTQRLKSSK
jgi:hypothetical protein